MKTFFDALKAVNDYGGSINGNVCEALEAGYGCENCIIGIIKEEYKLSCNLERKEIVNILRTKVRKDKLEKLLK